MRERLNRLGAMLGNWNDRHARHDSRSEATRRYRVIDRLAGWLYTLPERRLGCTR